MSETPIHGFAATTNLSAQDALRSALDKLRWSVASTRAMDSTSGWSASLRPHECAALLAAIEERA